MQKSNVFVLLLNFRNGVNLTGSWGLYSHRSFSFFCIVVSSLSVFIVECFLFFGVKKSVGSIYASGQ